MTYSKKEREQYNQYRTWSCMKLGITENVFNQFKTIGKKLRQQYENRCNTDISDETYESIVNPIYEKADKLAKNLGLYIYYQTDPRGATIYLDKKPISENNYTVATLIY